jgi:hypothetical protein
MTTIAFARTRAYRSAEDDVKRLTANTFFPLLVNFFSKSLGWFGGEADVAFFFLSMVPSSSRSSSGDESIDFSPFPLLTATTAFKGVSIALSLAFWRVSITTLDRAI